MTKMLKILYFTPFYSPQSEAAATRAYWLAKVLSEEGHDVEVLNGSSFFFPTPSNKSSFIHRLIKEVLCGIELSVKILLKRSNLVIISSPPFFTAMLGAQTCVLSKKKFILDVRDLYPEIFFELNLIGSSSMIGKTLRILTGICYRKSKATITVTDGLAKEISNYNAKPLVIMNGYDDEIFYPQEKDSKFDRFTLVFHGNLGRVQNIDTLLKLADELIDTDIDILVAGDGPKVDQITRAGKRNIRYLGAIPYQEIPALLRKCHVGLSFRTDDKIGRDAFPVKVFEYVGCGLPVIITPRCDAGRLIEKESMGREFANDDINHIRNYVLDLYKTKPSFTSPKLFTRRNQAKKIIPLIERT